MAGSTCILVWAAFFANPAQDGQTPKPVRLELGNEVALEICDGVLCLFFSDAKGAVHLRTRKLESPSFGPARAIFRPERGPGVTPHILATRDANDSLHIVLRTGTDRRLRYTSIDGAMLKGGRAGTWSRLVPPGAGTQMLGEPEPALLPRVAGGVDIVAQSLVDPQRIEAQYTHWRVGSRGGRRIGSWPVRRPYSFLSHAAIVGDGKIQPLALCAELPAGDALLWNRLGETKTRHAGKCPRNAVGSIHRLPWVVSEKGTFYAALAEPKGSGYDYWVTRGKVGEKLNPLGYLGEDFVDDRFLMVSAPGDEVYLFADQPVEGRPRERRVSAWKVSGPEPWPPRKIQTHWTGGDHQMSVVFEGERKATAAWAQGWIYVDSFQF